MVLWESPSLAVIIVVAVMVIVLEGLVFFVARQSDLAAQAAGELAAPTAGGEPPGASL